MQLSAAVGINRILVLTHLIDVPLTTPTSDNTEIDDININYRQVRKGEIDCFIFSFFFSETSTL